MNALVFSENEKACKHLIYSILSKFKAIFAEWTGLEFRQHSTGYQCFKCLWGERYSYRGLGGIISLSVTYIQGLSEIF